MGEHLNITSDLLKQGLPAFEMNRHTGETPPIAGYRLSYMAEKMECIFDGSIKVTAATDEDKTTEIEMPKGPFTIAQIDDAITAIAGSATAPKKDPTKQETIVLIRSAALQATATGRWTCRERGCK